MEDGRLIFQAVAWFPALADLRFHCQGMHSNVLDFKVSEDGKGNLVVENALEKTPGLGEDAGLAEDELRAKLAGEREKWVQMRGFLEGMLGGLRVGVVLRTPGRILSAVHARKLEPNAVRTEFKGDDLLALMDQLMKDDELALKLLRSKSEGPEALLALLGEKGPLKLTADGRNAASFDYAGEVEAARATFAAAMEPFGAKPPPERTGPVEGARVVAAKIVLEADSDNDLSPMSESERGLSLALAVGLPSRAMRIDEVQIEELTASDGRSLLPEDEWQRRISFPKLTRDGRTAYFDLPVRVDPATVPGFRAVRGLVKAQAMGDVQEVDLGFASIEPGQEGGAFGAAIQQVTQEYEDRWSVEFRFQVGVDSIESMGRRRANGAIEPLSRGGYSSSGDACTVSYTLEGAPAEGEGFVARMVTEIIPVEVPFALEHVDAFGRPATAAVPPAAKPKSKKKKK